MFSDQQNFFFLKCNVFISFWFRKNEGVEFKWSFIRNGLELGVSLKDYTHLMFFPVQAKLTKPTLQLCVYVCVCVDGEVGGGE